MGPNECDCDHMCAGHPQCMAIWVYDKDQCWYTCTGAAAPPTDTPVKRSLDIEINLSVKEATLASIASFIAARVEGELLVPASRLDEKITFSAKKLTLREAVTKLGLVAR